MSCLCSRLRSIFTNHSLTLFSLFFLKLEVKVRSIYKVFQPHNFLIENFLKTPPHPSFSTIARSHKFSQLLFVTYLLNLCFIILDPLHLKIFLYNSKIESVLNAIYFLSFSQTGIKKCGATSAAATTTTTGPPPHQQQQHQTPKRQKY